MLLVSRSQGHLCLPVRYTRAFPEALEKLSRGEFRYVRDTPGRWTPELFGPGW